LLFWENYFIISVCLKKEAIDLSEPKLISPMLDEFMMGDPLSEHHGVRCCPAMRKDSDSRYIVKIISVPASQVQLDALLLTGAYSTQAAALSYFKEMADDVAEEVEILKKLAKFEGFLPYEDYQIVPMEDAVGYDVYLLSPYKRSLDRFLKSKPVTHLNAVNLGLDLCASMAMCRRAGFLYADLKPSNIFVNEKNEFCIGDLGFIRLNALKYASLPERYRSPYTAPEIQDAMSCLNSTVDIYAIGMILYSVYNDGKLPKESELNELAPPIYADYEMSQIILKACDPDPEKRWQDPLQFGQALVAYMQRNSVNDTPIVPLPEPVIIPETEPDPVSDESNADQETISENTAVSTSAELTSTDEEIQEELSAAILSPEYREDGESIIADLDDMDDIVEIDAAEDILKGVKVFADGCKLAAGYALEHYLHLRKHAERLCNGTEILTARRTVGHLSHKALEVKNSRKQIADLLAEHKAVLQLTNRLLTLTYSAYVCKRMLDVLFEKACTHSSARSVEHPEKRAFFVLGKHSLRKLKITSRGDIHLKKFGAVVGRERADVGDVLHLSLFDILECCSCRDQRRSRLAGYGFAELALTALYAVGLAEIA
jgi:serine/threonine protein kinase